MKSISHCRLCESEGLKKIFELAPMALVDDYDSGLGAERFPTELFVCAGCGLVQLGVVVDPKKMFHSKYAFRTGSSPGLVRHFEVLADGLTKLAKLKAGSLAIDVGCNDGTFLKQIEKISGSKILGIDPAAPASFPSIRTALSTSIVEEILQYYGPADLITATNVLGHVDNLGEFLNCVGFLLKSDGFFVCEVGSLGAITKNSAWETIYHEHLSYFDVSTLGAAMRKNGFRPAFMSEIAIHGGSIRMICRKGQPERRAAALHWSEQIEAFESVKPNIVARRKKILALCGDEGIVAFGASAKGSVILQQTGLAPLAVVDDTPTKQSKTMPGTEIPIVPRRTIRGMEGKILILAWNEAAAIGRSLPEFAGRMVVAAPQPYVM